MQEFLKNGVRYEYMEGKSRILNCIRLNLSLKIVVNLLISANVELIIRVSEFYKYKYRDVSTRTTDVDYNIPVFRI